MSVPIFTVDAFTDRAFAGNPAGVCLLEAPEDAGWMQRVAAEMKHAETAFVVPREGGFDLRWFTPTIEMDLCGHATLASAHVLWETDALPAATPARFHTRSGLLTATRAGDAIEMDFPSMPVVEAKAPAGLAAALSVRPLWIGSNKMDYLVEVESEAVVRGLDPDMTALSAVDARGIIVTSRPAKGPADFVSRFFAPRAGVPEDPATGSAHCALAPYWGDKLGKKSLVGHQLSSRGAVIRVRNVGDRVMLGGQALTVMRGTLVGAALPAAAASGA